MQVTWFSSAAGRRSFAVAVALAALAGFVPAAVAAAAPSERTGGEASLSGAFNLRGSNGFSLDVESEGGVVTIVASERRPPIATFSRNGAPRPAAAANGAASIYRVRANDADPTRIEVGLGRVGSISVSFRPSGRSRVTHLAPGRGACGRTTRVVRRLGAFVGAVEFEGEGGYTSVHATRAPGSVGTALPSGCEGSPRALARVGTAPTGEQRGAVLSAVNRSSGARFEARTTASGAAFLATWRERLEGGVVVSRRAYAGASRGAFAFAEDLHSARVRPPAPFTGSARYRAGRGGGSDRWTGSLTATFPGAAIPMTGPGFRARLRAPR